MMNEKIAKLKSYSILSGHYFRYISLECDFTAYTSYSRSRISTQWKGTYSAHHAQHIGTKSKHFLADSSGLS